MIEFRDSTPDVLGANRRRLEGSAFLPWTDSSCERRLKRRKRVEESWGIALSDNKCRAPGNGRTSVRTQVPTLGVVLTRAEY